MYVYEGLQEVLRPVITYSAKPPIAGSSNVLHTCLIVTNKVGDYLSKEQL